MSTTKVLVGTVVSVLLASEARADPVVLTEKAGHVTQAVVTIDATPSEIYQLITDYARWPAVLSDVTFVKIEAGGRRDAKVRFRSRALEHEVAIVFDNEPNRAIRFHSVDAPPGARARGEYLLQPIDGGRRTRVLAAFYLDVGGVAGLFVRNAKVRSMRRAKLERDLVDTTRWLSLHRPAANVPVSAR